ncbi:MAG: hypothetical protein KKB91_09250 [Proteobacteria bacterium]|jgi:hypothetical protein|nr:hypothetical protein [Desulfocapsa sp.]MBU3944317.1 hypothetical protein [Pseudomonadota bacterium]MCG2744084.1 hypothetical protein [Desulfobacteraceae bacterium]MBU3984683.1 hypothetical protein [Pseudomonadota bacterium]MBU4028086.1 hypothetical protein [Pseudomonadota bacterium]
MIDYSDWELRKLSVDAIRLDKQNPRLPEEMLNEPQKSIIQYMIEEFKILEIAKSIAKNGFFINELPIVAKEGNHFVVVEGNRRITALKLLRNPDIAPPRKKHTYSRLAEDVDTNQWEKLPMYIAPSREAVAPILIARHGSEMTSPWQRIMKMRFLAGDVLKKVPYEEIADRYSVPIAEVRTAAATMLVREMVREADIDDDRKDKYLSEKFQTSTLTRFMETSSFIKKTGFQVNGAALQYEIPKDEFLQIILRMFKDIADETITSRNEVDERKKYISDIFEEITSGKKEENTFEAEQSESEPDKQEPRKPKPRKRVEKLIADTLDFNTGSLKLNELIKEGQKMSVGVYPNAGGLLIRTILDLAVQRLYDINGAISETVDQNGLTLGLTKRINNLHGRHGDWFESTAIRKKFQRFVAHDSQSFVHIETLNDYVHGDYGRPTTDDLRNFWSQIEPLIEMILEED